jgi:hypothetical protein
MSRATPLRADPGDTSATRERVTALASGVHLFRVEVDRLREALQIARQERLDQLKRAAELSAQVRRHACPDRGRHGSPDRT